MTHAPLILLALILLAMIARRALSFGAQRPRDYRGTGPAIDLRRSLNGPLTCEGVIFGPAGRVTSRFTARMHGAWDGASGRLSESFLYSTGARQDRAWDLRLGEDGRFSATAADVIGVARGEVSGAAIRMTYRLRLPADAGGHVLSVTDWLYLGENGTILNRSEMRKFGIKVAELFAVMRPATATASN
ncbi:DUF3833 domain-containing protein [Antarcticimicrobium luteum]|uniref:DUF3833 domain-containing protein n=1 Tax=Antarcticimicrobium luteum TaxID=2547397 RepID=A0A4V3AS25_9RHOB|nr:DUF3833 domain-containing protein [Antarcticimicrobium luteum]TDK48797.1 DUF3833 domain-containing protein [Antarcticimicrobium luteum]